MAEKNNFPLPPTENNAAVIAEALRQIQEGNAAEALEALSGVIDRLTAAGGMPDALLLAEALRARGTAYFSLRNLHASCRDFTAAVKSDPNNAVGFFDLGVVTSLLDNGASTAMKCYNRALELDDSLADCYYNRGNLHDSLGEYREAIADFTRAIELVPEMTAAWNNRGNARVELADYTGALADFEEVIRLNPERENAYTNRGYVREVLGDTEGALADYNRTLEKSPNDLTALANRTRLLSDMRRAETQDAETQGTEEPAEEENDKPSGENA